MRELWVRRESNPALAVDLSDLPRPKVESAGLPSRLSQAEGPYRAEFAEVARSVGIDFMYVPAPDDSTEGKRVVELTGGGVAALDYDADGWPDLFFTQGGLLPEPGPDAPSDRLFRNVGGRFEDASAVAGLGSSDYGQGTAVGDYNGDGFADVYVCNLGVNRLFVNNGDGTFGDVTSALPHGLADWSTSAAMADLTGDGLPDLYVTNYLAGDDLFTAICQQDSNSPPRICTPDEFDAAQDRLLVNLGDGRFADQTDSAGIVVPGGKGLGVLVADFLDSGNLQVFVANDGVPNFFFVPQPGKSPLLVESAASLGLAMNGEGQAQACMGMAAGDADGDGRLDVFVTNFDRESNTLYRNGDGLFEDASRPAGVREPSYRLLGFGTQFLDADLDGDEDLILTNGHVDDFSDDGTPYRMRAQYLENRGRGVFVERFGAEAGEFFDQEHLGRGLCRLDFNRDGRPDAAITHLDTPAALLANRADPSGHFLKLRLVATVGARDAVGAVVTVTSGDWSHTLQRVAGDGYQCANESVQMFGLGDRGQSVRLDVRWPDGSTQAFSEVAADADVVCVQGQARARVLPK